MVAKRSENEGQPRRRAGADATPAKASARERLLAAADELFYAEGIHTVGIDKVIARAGVAKASLYDAFENKDDLVCTYLERRAEKRQRRIEEFVANAPTPRAKMLALFDAMAVTVSEPRFRGCAFINASSEGPREGNKVTATCKATRDYSTSLLIELARAHGAKDPIELGKRVALLYDGALVSAALERDKDAVARAKELAALIIDAS